MQLGLNIGMIEILTDRREFLKVVPFLAGSLLALACGSPSRESQRPEVVTPAARSTVPILPLSGQEVQIIRDEAARLGVRENSDELARWTEISRIPVIGMSPVQQVNERFAHVAFNMQESSIDVFNQSIYILNSHMNRTLGLVTAGGDVIIDNRVYPMSFTIDARSSLSFRLAFGRAIIDDKQYSPLGVAFEFTRYLNMLDRANDMYNTQRNLGGLDIQYLSGYGYGKEAQAYIKAYGLGYKDTGFIGNSRINEQHALGFIRLGSNPDSIEWQQYVASNLTNFIFRDSQPTI